AGILPHVRQHIPHDPAARFGVEVEYPNPGGYLRLEPLPRLPSPASPLRFFHPRRVRTPTAARLGGGPGGEVTVSGAKVVPQPRGVREGVRVQAGRGLMAVQGLADPDQGETLVVLLRLIPAIQEGGQVRQDQPFGLPTEGVEDPTVLVAHVGCTP